MYSLNRVSSWVMLLAALALLLAACGKSGPDDTDTPSPAAQGVLEVALAGVETADIIVASGTETVWQGAITGAKEWTLKPGIYAVDGLPVAGMLDPTLARVEVTANGRTRLTLNYEVGPNQTPPGGAPADPVTALAAVTAVDMGGVALPSRLEVNANKDVMIYASQTEEPVCVTVRATDSRGHPVAGAQLTVNTAESEFMDDRIAIIRGCAELSGMSAQGLSTQGLSTAAFRDSLYTDANGEATFTLYASLGTDEVADEGDVARIVVSAEGDGGSALVEFKLVPYNLAHLYLNGEAADMRTGSAFEEINLFDTNDRIENPRRNFFNIDVSLFAKQPEDELEIEDLGFVCFFITDERDRLGGPADVVSLEGFDDIVALEPGAVLIDPPFPGTPPTADCYRDYDGNVDLVPNPELGPEDTPFQATVRAVLYTALDFGDTTYYFPLKDVTVTKRYISAVLTIDKHVDNHVLTWFGDNVEFLDNDSDFDGVDELRETDNDEVVGEEIDEGEPFIDYTLEPTNSVPADSVFTTTVTLTVRNPGPGEEGFTGETAYNTTLRDELPAELGVVESTITDGGSYNSLNHAITWHLDVLAPGTTVTRTFQVYIRQKPGFCVDPADLLAATFYSQPFTFANSDGDDDDDNGDDNGDNDTGVCYTDPYEVINGGALRDVTVAYFPVDGPDNAESTQQVVDFNGYANEDQVIIWAVRPLFDIDKVLVNTQDSPFDVGMASVFDITITNIDRAAPGGAYAELAAEYPSEFDGTTRDNPYARDVILSDVFVTGLDYTHAQPLVVSDDEGVAADMSYAPVFVGDPNVPPPAPFAPYLVDFGDKAIVWEPIAEMGGGDTGTTRIKLNNNLPGFHLNVGALTAGNMNQGIDLGDCLESSSLAEAFADLFNLSAAGEVAEAEFGDLFEPRFSFILDCDQALVLAPFDAWLELNDIGNYDLGAEALQFISVVERGDEYIYLFSIQNGGSDTADGTTLDVTLDAASADKATLTGGALFIIDPAGTLVATLAATSASDDAVSFGPYDHPVGFTAVFVVAAEADKVGNATATATVDWDANVNNTQFPFLPYSVEETVSIQPPQ